MPREASSYVSLLLFCAAIILNAGCTSGVPDRCLELIGLDVDEIESHLSKLNLTDVPTVKMMTAGFKCPISALPFGTLKSDWARLLLLQEAQPDGSIIKLKLVRLMRLLIIAYYQMEERIDDVTVPESAKKSLAGETTTTQPYCPNRGNTSGASSNNANRHCSYTDSFSNNVTRLATKSDCPRTKSNATVIEIVTMKSLSSLSGTTTVIPSDTTRQDDVTSLIRLGATTTQHYPDDAKKAALKTLGNCLKHSLKDVARRSSSKVFEILKNKAKYIESERPNEIDDRGKRTVVRISPPKNEFWRYVTFPTRAPLTAASMVPAYRMRELSGLRMGPRKSWKRMKLNNDIYEGFRRFYGVGKNEKDTK